MFHIVFYDSDCSLRAVRIILVNAGFEQMFQEVILWLTSATDKHLESIQADLCSQLNLGNTQMATAVQLSHFHHILIYNILNSDCIHISHNMRM